MFTQYVRFIYIYLGVTLTFGLFRILCFTFYWIGKHRMCVFIPILTYFNILTLTIFHFLPDIHRLCVFFFFQVFLFNANTFVGSESAVMSISFSHYLTGCN